jgi:RNA polymerase-binding protein DksA
LSFAGGVLGFSGAAYGYLARRRWSYLKIGDGLLPAVLLAFAFGEVGYFLSVRPLSLLHFFFSLFYFLSFLSAAAFLKKEPRTGATFYLYGAVFFFLYLLSQSVMRRFFSVDFLVALAYLGFFVLGWKNGGYMVSFTYPQDFVQKLKERLLRYRGKIEEEEKQIRAEDVLLEGGEASRSAEAIDEASEEIGHSFVQVTLSRLRDLKKQIDQALGKMRAGKYGLCERCGRPIDKARLEAFPEATLCLKCEQLREEKVAE